MAKSLLKHHCYCPMLLMRTTKTAVCLQTKAVFHHLYVLYRDVSFHTLVCFQIFFRIKETGIKLIKYDQNMDKISLLSKDRLYSGKRLDTPSLNTVSKH